MNLRLILLQIIILSCTYWSSAQDSLSLPKSEPRLKIVHSNGFWGSHKIAKNSHLKVVIYGEESPIKGRYTSFSDTSLTINSREIPFSQIESIHISNRLGQGIGLFLMADGLAGIGFGLLIMDDIGGWQNFEDFVYDIVGGVIVASAAGVVMIGGIVISGSIHSYSMDNWHFYVE